MHQLFYKFLITSLQSVFLFSLAVFQAHAAASDITRIYHQIPALESFGVCFGGGCAEIRHISINTEEWQKITTVFNSNISSTQNNIEQECK